MKGRIALAAALPLTLAAGGPVYTAGLTPGQYALNATGGQTAGSVCVADLRPLLQAAHGPDECQFYTVSQRATATRASYECAGGSGLVDLKAITPRSAVVKASGVRGSMPYAVTVNARRSGDCR